MQLYHHAANFINNLQILKLARKFPDNVFYTALFPGKSLRRRRLDHTNIYLPNKNTHAILLLDRFLSLFEQYKLFQQSIHRCKTHYGIACIPKAGLRTKCPVCSRLNSLKLSSFFSFFILFSFFFFNLCFAIFIAASHQCSWHRFLRASRQTRTSYRLLPTYYNCLLFSMHKVPAKSIVQKPCSIQMDFTKYCTVINTCRQAVSPIAYMTQLLSHKAIQPPHFSYYAESQLSQEWNYPINHRWTGCTGNDI